MPTTVAPAAPEPRIRLAASDRLARHVGEPDRTTSEDVRAFYAVPMGDILMFAAAFITLGYRQRRNPATSGLQHLAAWSKPTRRRFSRREAFDKITGVLQ